MFQTVESKESKLSTKMINEKQNLFNWHLSLANNISTEWKHFNVKCKVTNFENSMYLSSSDNIWSSIDDKFTSSLSGSISLFFFCFSFLLYLFDFLIVRIKTFSFMHTHNDQKHIKIKHFFPHKIQIVKYKRVTNVKKKWNKLYIKKFLSKTLKKKQITYLLDLWTCEWQPFFYNKFFHSEFWKSKLEVYWRLREFYNVASRWLCFQFWWQHWHTGCSTKHCLTVHVKQKQRRKKFLLVKM